MGENSPNLVTLFPTQTLIVTMIHLLSLQNVITPITASRLTTQSKC
jgi:hypothetical protein